ncbi:peptidase M50B-like protein [Fontibacillus phaseoli]|uniref:Peptidase M50B-like protein n=1 Tax=Fontibacillus phaseoli TaxID=1416533 RepID=A0A369BIQ2_9BACL|nr:M50 family metallopeptidase [Fontibacillus phaseoli]RCX21453.1 peptidase M50B-like protein [Fontibacillus phaseoli]
MNKWLKAFLFLIGAAILTRLIPFSNWFRMLDTMIHELGHAVVTLLVSGRVLRIELNPDHSGVTYSLLISDWSQIVVSLAGYITASLFAIAMFYGYYRQKQGIGLIIISVLALATIVFFVRSGYGLWWLIIFIAVNMAFYFIGGWIRNFYYLLLAFLCLEESLMGPVTLLLRSLTAPAQAGDAANLANLTMVPALVWSLLFLGISLLCAMSSLQLYWKNGQRENLKSRRQHLNLK